MELTRSYETVIPASLRARFEIRETRNAAAVLRATNGSAFEEVLQVLDGFCLRATDITSPGGSKSQIPIRLDRAFRDLGWREGRHDTHVTSTLRIMPSRAHRETRSRIVKTEVPSEAYKVDNVKDRMVVDVEWHAKDGNLDRDLAAYRALYESGIVDGGVIVTRSFSAIRALAIRLKRASGFSTTTTTTLEKLEPRLCRGDSGGCPVLAVAITDRCYAL
jgi:hypothetical protein